MRLPGLNYLKDKWVLIGLAAGAGVYLFTQHHPHHVMPAHHPMPMRRHGTSSSHEYFPQYDHPGLYEVPGGQGDFSHLRFSGQAELQRRLTIS